MEFSAQIYDVMDFVVQDIHSAPVKLFPVVQTSANAAVILPLYVAEDRRRFFQQVGKAAEKFKVKLVRPHACNLVAPFFVKGKEEASSAYIFHVKAFVDGKETLLMPVQFR